MVFGGGCAPKQVPVSSDGEAPLARVHDYYIYPKEIAPPKIAAEHQRSKLSDQDYQEWEKDFESRKLKGIIYYKLQDNFLKKTKMEATVEELSSFARFFKEQRSLDMQRFQKSKNELLLGLESKDLTQKQRDQKIEHLKTIENLIARKLKRDEENKLIPNYEQIQARSIKAAAAMSVISWKFNKALYKKYGGRVIFQQAGFEALDGYEKFLDKAKKIKSYEILDDRYSMVFESMKAYFEMGHSFVDKKDADEYFDKPWWNKK